MACITDGSQWDIDLDVDNNVDTFPVHRSEPNINLLLVLVAQFVVMASRMLCICQTIHVYIEGKNQVWLTLYKVMADVDTSH